MNRFKLKNVTVFVAGAVVMGLGIGLCNTSRLGTDPMAVFCSGLSISFAAVSFAMWNAIINIIQIAVSLVVDKKQISIFSIMAMIITSYSISLIPEISLKFNYLCLVMGVVFMALGISLMVKADVGKSPYDASIYAFMNRFNKKYSVIRWSFDIFFLTAGYLLGGIIGIGTILGFVVIGKLVEFFTSIFSKINI